MGAKTDRWSNVMLYLTVLGLSRLVVTVTTLDTFVVGIGFHL